MAESSGPTREQVAELLLQMRKERQRAAYVRTGATLGVILILVIFTWRTYSKFTTFDVNTFVTALQVEGAKRVWPAVSNELDSLADAAVPALKDAFAAESLEFGPRLQTELEKESEILVTNMTERLGAALDVALKDANLAKKSKIIEKFPSFKDNPEALEALNDALTRSTRDWAHNQLDTTFARHLQLLQSINETFQRMESQVRQELNAGKTPTSLEELLTLFLEIVNMRLNPNDAVVPAVNKKVDKKRP